MGLVADASSRNEDDDDDDRQENINDSSNQGGNTSTLGGRMGMSNVHAGAKPPTDWEEKANEESKREAR
jgi:hypothetical protein